MPDLRAELWTMWQIAGGVQTPPFKLTNLDNAYSITFQDAMNEPGIGSLSLPLDAPECALVRASTEVRIYLWDSPTPAFAFIQEREPHRILVAETEELGQEMRLSGPGRASLFARSVIYPYKGVAERVMGQYRLFSFASPDFPNSGGWGQAVAVRQHTEFDAEGRLNVDPVRYATLEYTTVSSSQEPDVVELVRAPAPLGWKVPQAWWIWGTGEFPAGGMPEGTCYFRSAFQLPAGDNAVTIAATADNHYTLYLDGTPVLGDFGDAGESWMTHKRAEVTLPGGVYYLCAIASNDPLPNYETRDNPAGFLCAVYDLDEQGELRNTFARSGPEWNALPYPSGVPGWTVGQILYNLIQGAQQRGGLEGIYLSFTAATDSAGNPWNTPGVGGYVPGFSIPVGGTMLDVLNAMVEQGHIDFEMTAGDPVMMHAYNQGWSAHPESAPATILLNTGDPNTSSIGSLEHTPQTEPKTRMLVKWSAGWFEVYDSSEASWGVHETYLTLDATTETEARRQAQLVMNEVRNPVSSIVVGLHPSSPVDQPYTAFRPREWVMHPDVTGALKAFRVHAISVSQDQDGLAQIGLELNSRVLVVDREQYKLMQVLGRGVVGNAKARSALDTTTGTVQL